MKSFIAALRSLVLPWGRTVGRRLVLDGDQGEISIYDDTNARVGVLTSADPPGLTVGAAGSVQAALVSSDQAGRLDFPHTRPAGATHAAILSAIRDEGLPTEHYTLQLLGPTVLASAQAAQIQLNSPNADASSNASVSLRAGSGVVVIDQGAMVAIGPRLVVRPAASASPAVSVEGAAGHSGHLLQASAGGTVVWSMGATGDTRVRPTASASPALSVEGAAGHSGLLLQLAMAGQINFTVDTAGVITQYADHQFNDYVPTVGGAGTATWTARTGWWQRIGRMIYVCVHLQVNAAGSGASLVTVSMPTDVYRGTRQTLVMHTESTGPNGSHIGNGTATFFAGGSGAATDRLRTSSNDATNRDLNLTGADLLAGGVITIQGWYREA